MHTRTDDDVSETFAADVNLMRISTVNRTTEALCRRRTKPTFVPGSLRHLATVASKRHADSCDAEDTTENKRDTVIIEKPHVIPATPTKQSNVADEMQASHGQPWQVLRCV